MHVIHPVCWAKPNTRVTSRHLVCLLRHTAKTKRAAELARGDSGVRTLADVAPG